jgi:hypothetical protein
MGMTSLGDAFGKVGPIGKFAPFDDRYLVKVIG